MRPALVAVVMAGLAAGAAQAAEAKAPPPADVEPIDADFLEFLGSLDTEDEDWREFLESRPINNAAGKPEEKQTSTATDPKQDKVKKP